MGGGGPGGSYEVSIQHWIILYIEASAELWQIFSLLTEWLIKTPTMVDVSRADGRAIDWAR